MALRRVLTGLLALSAGCFLEPGLTVHGTIVQRVDSPTGRAEAYVVVWPEGADCSQAAKVYIDPGTVVRMQYGSVVVDTNWTALTVGHTVTTRIWEGGETSCPVGTSALYFVVNS
jgi:hypothetical protein